MRYGNKAPNNGHDNIRAKVAGDRNKRVGISLVLFFSQPRKQLSGHEKSFSDRVDERKFVFTTSAKTKCYVSVSTPLMYADKRRDFNFSKRRSRVYAFFAFIFISRKYFRHLGCLRCGTVTTLHFTNGPKIHYISIFDHRTRSNTFNTER